MADVAFAKFAMRHRAVLLALSCLGVLHQLEASPSQSGLLNDLLDRSPFGIPETKNVGDALIGNALEFRGILEENGSPIFSIFEITPRRSTWVGLNNSANGISIKSYDAATMTITVVYQEKHLTLPLKGGVAWVRSAPSTPTRAPQPTPALDTSYHDQPFRLGHVAEETAIRRAVRRPAVERPNAPASTQH